MDSRLLFYALALLSGFFGAGADGLLNHWVKKGGGWYLFGGYLCWNIALVIFTRLLKADLLMQVVVLFLVANSIGVLLISQFVFHEHLSPQKWIGIGLALLGILIIETAAK